jgi:Arc/MetJ-type ribon-helix-helix transcriptional regulator
MSNLIQAEIPDRLWQQATALVNQGWASNVQEVVNESLRRYLESHQDVLAERFIREDVAWALHGDD